MVHACVKAWKPLVHGLSGKGVGGWRDAGMLGGWLVNELGRNGLRCAKRMVG